MNAPERFEVSLATKAVTCTGCGGAVAVGDRTGTSLKPPRQRMDPLCWACVERKLDAQRAEIPPA